MQCHCVGFIERRVHEGVLRSRGLNPLSVWLLLLTRCPQVGATVGVVPFSATDTLATIAKCLSGFGQHIGVAWAYMRHGCADASEMRLAFVTMPSLDSGVRPAVRHTCLWGPSRLARVTHGCVCCIVDTCGRVGLSQVGLVPHPLKPQYVSMSGSPGLRCDGLGHKFEQAMQPVMALLLHSMLALLACKLLAGLLSTCWSVLAKCGRRTVCTQCM